MKLHQFISTALGLTAFAVFGLAVPALAASQGVITGSGVNLRSAAGTTAAAIEVFDGKRKKKPDGRFGPSADAGADSPQRRCRVDGQKTGGAKRKFTAGIGRDVADNQRRTTCLKW